jgi:hypothetical protein|tara:strand:+ start:157 stop:936 length:780 start_codon:yes stop_codon:yes gene_type:complete
MSHWYDKQGNPRYEVPGKNGMRPTTLREARKYGWVPSVSTVWGDVVHKPMLNKWMQKELMASLWAEAHSAKNLSQSMGYLEYEKLARERFSRNQQDVMNRGTIIHDHLEQYFKSGNAPEGYELICRNVHQKLNESCPEGGDWVSENSFSHPSGFGGKVDLMNDEWVVDFKTKVFPDKPNVKKMVYDDYGAQLAAYNLGLGGTRRIMNLFIDVGEGHSVLEWEHEDVERLTRMFSHALALWKLIKKYDPSWTDLNSLYLQ